MDCFLQPSLPIIVFGHRNEVIWPTASSVIRAHQVFQDCFALRLIRCAQYPTPSSKDNSNVCFSSLGEE